jgi:CMP/dCMP kinase
MAHDNPVSQHHGGDQEEAEKAAILGSRLTPSVIAIDGPAASGKSTVGLRLAEVLGYLFFDTGVMYRAVTWAALERGLDAREGEAMGELAEHLSIDIAPAAGENADGQQSTVLVNGRDVTAQIRSGQVDRHVSAVSAHEQVRSALTRNQRRIGLKYGLGDGDRAGIVMVGRDIGTVVLSEAPVKVYLDATPEERARRRYKEWMAKGVPVDYRAVLSDLIRRDEIDSTRSLAPLQIADDATVLDTTRLSPAEVVERILELVRRAVATQEKA